jgi:RNA polymerase sigma-70 factor, ECF subfamily
MTDSRSDEELVRLIQSSPGTDEARRLVSVLLKRWRASIFSWCWRVVRDRELAEDLAQDCLVLIHRALPGFEPRAMVSSWMFAIVRNRCLSELRKGRHLRAEWEQAEQLANPAEGPEEQFERRFEEERVLAAMRGALTPEEQSALWLRAYEEWSIEDITRVLRVPGTSGARGMLQTARRKLRAALETGEEGGS